MHLELVPTTHILLDSDFHCCVYLQIAKGEGFGGLDAKSLNYTFLSSYLILFVFFFLLCFLELFWTQSLMMIGKSALNSIQVTLILIFFSKKIIKLEKSPILFCKKLC